MTSNTVKKFLTSFPIRNNLIMPSQKTFEKMNMTRQEYIFYKWSNQRRLKNPDPRDDLAQHKKN